MKRTKRGKRRQGVQASSPAGLRGSGTDPFSVPFWKRSLDLGVIVLTAPGWVPLMAAISAMIKLLSPGPLLFRQERTGLGGKSFLCLKFRTMHTGAETVAHEKHLAELIRSNRPMTKLDGKDSRLIPLAWLLRSTGLDELPQLFNVLRGEMSLVGPRPSTMQEYNACTPAQRARSKTLPGLTGLWQVNGKNRTTFDRMIELDILYVQNHCLWLDLGIMLRTPTTLLAQISEAILERKVSAPSFVPSFPRKFWQSKAPDAGLTHITHAPSSNKTQAVLARKS